MARQSALSSSPLAMVRRHFGLTQEELGLFLGLSRFALANIEAGRRSLSSTVWLRLMPLLQQLPPETPPVPDLAPEPPPAAVPDAGPLEARIDECRQAAQKLRCELRDLYQELRLARRWEQALPALLAAPPALPTTEEEAWHARAQRWLQRRQEDAAQALDGYNAARYHLLTARAEALEAEAAALLRCLPGRLPKKS